MIAKENFDIYIGDYDLVSCTIKNPNIITFMLQEFPEPGGSDDPYDYPTRITSVNISNKEEYKLGGIRWESGFKRPKLIDTGDNGYLIINSGAEATETGDTSLTMPLYTLEREEYMDSRTGTIAIHCIREIDGHIYAAGFWRKLFKRIGPKQWELLTSEADFPHLYPDIKGKFQRPYSFQSFDGFSANDIYACGEKGDLWHFNGRVWVQLSPPINSWLNKLICADDGYVYISSRWGDLLKGYYRDGEEYWEIIPQNVSSMDTGFEDMAWFQGKLYLSHSYGLFELSDGEVKRVDHSGLGHDTQFSFQHVTSGHGLLVSYGPRNAVMFDGKEWKALINPHHLLD